MKKVLFVLVTALALLGIMVVPALAGKGGKTGPAGKSNIAHLYLGPWPELDPAEPGAWGKIKYNLSGSTLDFVLNGHGLTAGSWYGLYSGGQLFGYALANGGGNVHIASSVTVIDLQPGHKFNLWVVNSEGGKLSVDRVLRSGEHGFIQP